MTFRSRISLRVIANLFGPAFLILLLHVLRIVINPYGYKWDHVMHFLGGASIAWMFWRWSFYLHHWNVLPELPRWFRGFTSLTFAVFIGVLWEFYEYAVFIWWIPAFDIRLADTMSDLGLDVCGALLFVFAFAYLEWKALERRSLRKKEKPVIKLA